MRPINDNEVLDDLARRMNGYGNGEKMARELDTEPRHLREIKCGGRPPSLRVARGLGWELKWVKVIKG